jgi:epsilon-lactone hydrolase
MDLHRHVREFRFIVAAAATLALALLLPLLGSEPSAADAARKTGTVEVPAFSLPLSSYMSEQARQTLVERPPFAGLRGDGRKLTLEEGREFVNAWYRPQVERAKAVYPVHVEEKRIAGVRTDVVTPKNGVPAKNSHRVLIALHGGSYSFATGGGLAGLAEAIPVAGTAQTRVIAIDYRTAPQHKFPAATEDVVAVYKTLLATYQPESIGIYGCSTGATLTATVIARLHKEKLPQPGAIGLFCGGATKDDQIEGDSYYTAAAAMGERIPAPGEPHPPQSYMKGTRADDPMVAPVTSLEVLAAFPPTLLITGTRDPVMSAAAHTHARLVKAGVHADLHVWDGMWHGFFFDVDLPESKDAYDVMARFFDRHLSRS